MSNKHFKQNVQNQNADSPPLYLYENLCSLRVLHLSDWQLASF